MGNNFSKSSLREDIKTRKPFVKRDVFVYVSILLLVACLFIFFILFNNASSQGFKVEIREKTILSHVYGKDFSITNEFKDSVVIERDGDNYTVKILTENGYNLLFVNESEKSVKMKDGDCPSKNCVHMQAITNAGAIYCAPRELKVTPLQDSEFVPPTIGVQG